MTLACPHCNAQISAPAPAGAPAAKAPSKYSVGAEAPHDPGPKPSVIPPPAKVPPKKPNFKWVTPVVVVVVLCAAGFFLYSNPSYIDAAKVKLGLASAPAPQPTNAPPTDASAATNAVAAVTNAPPPPAVWNLDLSTNNFPDYAAKGAIASSEYLVDGARIDGSVLSLIQGSGGPPEREFIIYLSLHQGETLEGLSVTVAPEQKTGVPRILQRWKADGKPALQSKSYAFGYAMKLELGKLNNNTIPGKIYLSVPDDDHSFLAGTFSAGIKKISLQPAAVANAATNQPPGRRRRPGGGPTRPDAPPRMPRPTTGGGNMIPL